MRGSAICSVRSLYDRNGKFECMLIKLHADVLEYICKRTIKYCCLEIPCERTANSARFFNDDSTIPTLVESRHWSMVPMNCFANLTNKVTSQSSALCTTNQAILSRYKWVLGNTKHYIIHIINYRHWSQITTSQLPIISYHLIGLFCVLATDTAGSRKNSK